MTNTEIDPGGVREMTNTEIDLDPDLDDDGELDVEEFPLPDWLLAAQDEPE